MIRDLIGIKSYDGHSDYVHEGDCTGVFLERFEEGDYSYFSYRVKKGDQITLENWPVEVAPGDYQWVVTTLEITGDELPEYPCWCDPARYSHGFVYGSYPIQEQKVLDFLVASGAVRVVETKHVG